jgi:hypothetical protein
MIIILEQDNYGLMTPQLIRGVSFLSRWQCFHCSMQENLLPAFGLFYVDHLGDGG